VAVSRRYRRVLPEAPISLENRNRWREASVRIQDFLTPLFGTVDTQALYLLLSEEHRMGEKRMHPEPHRFPETKTTLNLMIELGLMLVLSIFVFYIAATFDMFEHVVEIVRRYENWELDELVVVGLFLVMALSVFSVKRWLAFRKINAVLTRRNSALRQAVTQLRDLNGIIPICSACKKIRDDEGFWHQVESYIETHSHVEFTHGICPECTKMLYPDYFAQKTNRRP
jgi:hypothetical protein